ncbi:TetR family transcriptional regulator [Bacillus sp. AFS002410]|uniref:TetR/AcrR family transcriptional regulator n=1 Tax=Bacillus sp. AFS002410 TaxID=2033481 RepID=UPI000BF142F9|nr:TetR/AcrR family transcriptional regulator [Bacillus sp. AFS002410]PEJ47743.1 TetR family transcriptional regulator [Bacillus sp. AFS002410]
MSPKVSKEHQQQRRTKILEAAKQVFIENGYERTTMKHVMDASNVSRGGLYQYFANKEDLFEAILADSLSRVYDETRKKLNQKVDSYWELLLLRLFGESRVPNDKMDPLAPSTLEFFITGRNDSRRRKYGKERYHFGIKIYSDVIKEGQKNKEFSTKYDSEIVARMIVSFIDGLALDYAIISNEELMMREQSILFVEFLKMALEV